MTRRVDASARTGRIDVTLACSVCHTRNYKTTKVRRDGAAPLVLSKYCKSCDRHTIHEESR
ncbi:MAG: 50S ribosomal protein L33 [Deltaproteobacteria bacterium]|nr:50S ribosomal protein L33 [Deltaproteobacteria bacterium]